MEGKRAFMEAKESKKATDVSKHTVRSMKQMHSSDLRELQSLKELPAQGKF